MVKGSHLADIARELAEEVDRLTFRRSYSWE
jgi:hypothetical protein